MIVRCECCQLKAIVKSFPTHPCICGKTEWIRDEGPDGSWLGYCPKCQTEMRLSRKQTSVNCPKCNYVQPI